MITDDILPYEVKPGHDLHLKFLRLNEPLELTPGAVILALWRPTATPGIYVFWTQARGVPPPAEEAGIAAVNAKLRGAPTPRGVADAIDVILDDDEVLPLIAEIAAGDNCDVGVLRRHLLLKSATLRNRL